MNTNLKSTRYESASKRSSEINPNRSVSNANNNSNFYNLDMGSFKLKYDNLPYGSKMEFCGILADELGLSEKYIFQRWFHHPDGVPKKHREAVRRAFRKIEKEKPNITVRIEKK